MDLRSRRAPQHSIPGIVLACVSLVVMPLLSRAKRKVGSALGSAAMHADAKQAEFCSYLSAILLAGLLLNAFFGLWWADPAAALIMVPIIAKEGIEGLQGNACDEFLLLRKIVGYCCRIPGLMIDDLKEQEGV